MARPQPFRRHYQHPDLLDLLFLGACTQTQPLRRAKLLRCAWRGCSAAACRTPRPCGRSTCRLPSCSASCPLSVLRPAQHMPLFPTPDRPHVRMPQPRTECIFHCWQHTSPHSPPHDVLPPWSVACNAEISMCVESQCKVRSDRRNVGGDRPNAAWRWSGVGQQTGAHIAALHRRRHQHKACSGLYARGALQLLPSRRPEGCKHSAQSSRKRGYVGERPGPHGRTL